MKNFEGDEFAVQVIAKGSYVDTSAGDGKVWITETTTLRLNRAALNEALLAHRFNSRVCYDTEAEWQAYDAKIRERERLFKAKIADSLGICSADGSTPRGFMVSLVCTEIFTAVYIYEKEETE